MVSVLDTHSAADDSCQPALDADAELFDGREMVMVHQVMRREFGLLPGAVAGIAPEEQGSGGAEAIARHIAWLIKFLHQHHSSEDHVLWPLLVQRCGQETLTARMQSEHQELASCLDTVVQALQVWDDERTAASRDALEHALRQVITPLNAHLNDEEQHAVPLLERYVGAEEVRRAVEAGLAQFTPDEVTLVIGMLMYEGDPEMIDHVLEAMPPDIGAALRVAGPRAFARHSEQVHGTPTPPRSTELAGSAGTQ
ncbi:hemerythrin domain-containing protein [Mycobacterium sp. URHB0021]|jgi:hemerythrin-like domain-containing protein